MAVLDTLERNTQSCKLAFFAIDTRSLRVPVTRLVRRNMKLQQVAWRNSVLVVCNCNGNLFLLTKDVIQRKFELHPLPYSHKENDYIEIIVTRSDVRYCPSSVLDIMYFQYHVRTYFIKR